MIAIFGAAEKSRGQSTDGRFYSGRRTIHSVRTLVENPAESLGAASREVKNAGAAGAVRVAAMMSAAECSKRAAECLSAAQVSQRHDVQRAWQRLSDAWLAWSQTVDRLRDADATIAPFPRIGRRMPPDANRQLPTPRGRHLA
jgi:hypothetical protein